ncbi:Sec-independent protein translocase subunit TatB [Fodinicola feengrottensis]|uniref:Sec-independent protein translocase subunit TatB n=1 Tax=Fodinicola feengrottensis TaxID=435914 RepID=UPI0013D8153E|nr:Sec-independent protein translocase subunit TatB [Fodinicola feengrottensis]
MFENLGFMEIISLVLLGLFIFGPERLPKVIGDAARFLRSARQMARNATSELQNELGTDIDITDLNPRTFVRKHLLSDDDEVDDLSRPLREAFGDVQHVTDSINDTAHSLTNVSPKSVTSGGPHDFAGQGRGAARAASPLTTPTPPDPRAWEVDLG